MKLLNRLRFWLKQGQIDRDLAEEMRLHRKMLEDDFCRDGMTQEQARYAAARRFGNAAIALEESREQWSFTWLDSALQDLRYALRTLRRSKPFVATAVLTLGVGLGLNTVLFTAFNAYVLRPFAVRDPYSLYQVGWLSKEGGNRFFSWREYEEVRRRQDVFSDALAMSYSFVPMGKHRLAGMLVSGNYFRMLGADTLMGRPILEEDASVPGAQPVVVISHEAWKIVFGQDPGILGKKIILNGHPFEVIGVTRPEFTGLEDRPADFWIPVTMFRELKGGDDLFGPKQPSHLTVVGRLRPGVTPAQGGAALAGFVRASASRQREEATNIRTWLEPRSTPIPYSAEMVKVFTPVFAAFVLVLVAACANVANMMLARATARQREIGVRLSLGASRPRLLRQLLTESLLIALLGGLAAIAMANLTVDLGLKLLFATIPEEFGKVIRVLPLALDYRVLFFVLAAAVSTTLLFGLLPSLQATRTRLVDALRGEFGRFRASRLRDALVINQVTVCLVLLICAAMLLRSSDVFQTRDVGLRVKDVVHLRSDDASVRALVAARLAAEPAVAEIAAAGRTPLFGRLREIAVTPSGASELTLAGYNFVSPEYFHLFGIPILRGRGFTVQEAASEAPVIVISEATARRYWPGQDALGKSIRIEPIKRRFVDELPGFSEVQVVGIAKDVINGWVFDGTDRTCLYFPTSLRGKHAGRLLVRGKSAGSDTASTLQAILGTHWPELPFEVIPMDQVLAIQIYPFRAASWIATVLGAVALVLTISGMYGVMAYLVSQRNKEIGIRIALGATPVMVLRLVMRHSMKLTAVGLAIGLALSFAAAKLISFALKWRAADFAASLILVTAAALLAAFFPSRRASHLDPVSILRVD